MNPKVTKGRACQDRSLTIEPEVKSHPSKCRWFEPRRALESLCPLDYVSSRDWLLLIQFRAVSKREKL